MTRTPDRRIRNPLLYPAELRAHLSATTNPRSLLSDTGRLRSNWLLLNTPGCIEVDGHDAPLVLGNGQTDARLAHNLVKFLRSRNPTVFR